MLLCFWYFWREWIALIRAWFRTLGKRRVETPTERFNCLLFGAAMIVFNL